MVISGSPRCMLNFIRTNQAAKKRVIRTQEIFETFNLFLVKKEQLANSYTNFDEG